MNDESGMASAPRRRTAPRRAVTEERTGPLRDQLAVDRTNLANERTMLAWVRTALGLVVGGLTFFKFFGDDPLYRGFGAVAVVVGVLALGYGMARFERLRRRYGRLKAPPPRIAREQEQR